MRRSIEQWQKCDPKAMAFNQSAAAVMYAIADAKSDVLSLHREKIELLQLIKNYVSHSEKWAEDEELAPEFLDILNEMRAVIKAHHEGQTDHIANAGKMVGLPIDSEGGHCD